MDWLGAGRPPDPRAARLCSGTRCVGSRRFDAAGYILGADELREPGEPYASGEPEVGWEIATGWDGAAGWERFERTVG